jgi:hypothetical protein
VGESQTVYVQNTCVSQATGDLLETPRNLYSVAFRQFEMISALHINKSSAQGFRTPHLRQLLQNTAEYLLKFAIKLQHCYRHDVDLLY